MTDYKQPDLGRFGLDWIGFLNSKVGKIRCRAFKSVYQSESWIGLLCLHVSAWTRGRNMAQSELVEKPRSLPSA